MKNLLIPTLTAIHVVLGLLTIIIVAINIKEKESLGLVICFTVLSVFNFVKAIYLYKEFLKS